MKNLFKALNFKVITASGVVTPGDELWDAMTGSDGPPLTTRQLADQHWAVRAVIGHLARELAGIQVEDRHLTDMASGATFEVAPGGQAVRKKRSGGSRSIAALIEPHLRRVAKDLARFDEA